MDISKVENLSNEDAAAIEAILKKNNIKVVEEKGKTKPDEEDLAEKYGIPTSDNNYALEILQGMSVESKYWDKEDPIINADVVAMYVGNSSYKGKITKNPDGTPVKRIMLELVNEYGVTQFTSFSEKSQLRERLGKALKKYSNGKILFMDKLLGKKINIKTLNYDAVKEDEAEYYVFSAEIVGEATHKVKGIFSLEDEDAKDKK